MKIPDEILKIFDESGEHGWGIFNTRMSNSPQNQRITAKSE